MVLRQFRVHQHKHSANTAFPATHEVSTALKPSVTNPTIVPGQIQDRIQAAA